MSSKINPITVIMLILAASGCAIQVVLNILPARYWFYHGLLYIIDMGILCTIFAIIMAISVIFSKKANKADKPLGVLCALLLLFFWYLFPVSGPSNGSHWRYSCASNMKQIFIALQQYAADYAGNYPPANGAASLEMLRKNGYRSSHEVYVCPSTKTVRGKNNQPLTEETIDYVYIGGLNQKSDPKQPLLYDKLNNHGGYFGNVILGDGAIKSIEGNPWTQNIKK